jgi:hypothetical protein
MTDPTTVSQKIDAVIDAWRPALLDWLDSIAASFPTRPPTEGDDE